MKNTKIIGILLVRNEDRFIDRVLHNIKDFCDQIIIADHLSKDKTERIVKKFCECHQNCIYARIFQPGESHDLIKKFAGENVWIFGVDGDELYDPHGLSVLRDKLLAGEFDRWWLLFGNVINCITLDIQKKTASGYVAPPCRSMTKLYNFNAIVSWDGNCSERLHGGDVVFRPGYERTMYYDLYKEIAWERSFFRCLHFCFLQRSSTDNRKSQKSFIRKNIADQMSENLFKRLILSVPIIFGYQEESPLKKEKYMRGNLIEVDISDFV